MFYLCCYHDWPERKSEIREDPPKFWPNTEGYSSMSAGYETEAELREKNGIPDEPCKECGSIFSTHYSEPVKTLLLERGICHHCNHFLQLIGKQHALRINGVHWMGKAGDKGQGCGGRTFGIRMLGTGEEFQTSNLWCQGEIPSHFRERLPDNAEFIQIPKPMLHGQGYLGDP
jgi:hypothetical protein